MMIPKYKLVRPYKKPGYTIGRLYRNGILLCNTLEPPDRGLRSDMTLAEIRKIKVTGHTAIPTGIYELKLTYSYKFGRTLPELQGVKGFSGIRIHSGNVVKHTAGCILPGENKAVGMVLNSSQYVSKIIADLQADAREGNKVYIEIS